jgi:Mrp family chromosome partitioning ATPase
MAPTATATRHSPKQLPVEPTVFGRQLAFVTGKGGVGKTTVAAALALAASAGGREAIVCELGAQTHLACTPDELPVTETLELTEPSRQ